MNPEQRPYLVERSPGYFEYQLPVSVKLVIDLAGRIPLLMNERDEWELPGGKLEVGETPESTAVREAQEELDLEPERLDEPTIIDSWVYEIFPQRHVFVVSYGSEYRGLRDPRLSHEHKKLGVFEYQEINTLKMPSHYKDTIARWKRHLSR
ncbi:NUDIX hydrolase [Streptomyces sp. B6B3]|uniref:NUDIX hydrolase n=1 Tax=Streptomyces sp. B6B3 TaxID=3153570 RepID=UPI00325E93DA